METERIARPVPDRASLSELRDRDLFYRSPAEALRQRAIVDDTSVPNVNSMV